MNPELLKAATGRLLTLLFFLAGFGPLFGQSETIPSFQLEGQFTYFLHPNDEIAVDFSGLSGDGFMTVFEAEPDFATGIALRKVKANNWYTRYALVGLSIQENRNVTIQLREAESIFELIDGSTQRTSNLHLRFEKGKYFLTDKRLSFGLGVMLDPILTTGKTNPANPQLFPVSYTRVSLNLGVVPSLNLQFSERVGAFFMAPVSVLNTSFYGFFTDNPLIPESERRQGEFNVDVLAPNLQIVLGAQVKL